MKLLLIIICTCFLWVQSSAQTPDTAVATGQVTFLRNNSVVDFKYNKVFMDKTFLCKIGEHRYFVKDVPVGKHTFTVQFNGKKAKEGAEKLFIEIKAGEKYFVDVIFQDKWPIPNLYCIELAASSALRVLPSLKLSTRCDEKAH
ncbi:MAG: hypothetical protein H7X88_11930 [Gloeobacteraceae cyanobacterium ES-bin-316]|nr:hypothetical protein [Ferruginibacter sp.]